MVLASLGEVHGYGILNELKERVGGGWKPSPGAIYPALVALVESGHIDTTERDGSRLYSLTERGRRAAESAGSASRWSTLSDRAENQRSPHLGRRAARSICRRVAAATPAGRDRAETGNRIDPRADRRRDRASTDRRRRRWMNSASWQYESGRRCESPDDNGSGCTSRCLQPPRCFCSSSGRSATRPIPWFIFPLFGWGIWIAAHAVYAFVIRHPDEILIERAARKEREGR